MQETRTQVINRDIAKFEEIVGDLLRYYEDELRELLRGDSKYDDKAAEVQVSCLLTMSYATRAVITMKDYQIMHDQEVIEMYVKLLKKADPNFKPLEEIYKEQNDAEEAQEDDDDD